MAVLTVTDVRRHLYWAAGGPDAGGSGGGSTALLGQIFHDLYAALTGPDERINMSQTLELADASLESWVQTLIDHAYQRIVAPSLARRESVLQTQGAAVLGFWTATRELCAWLAAVMHALRNADANRSLESWRRELFTDAELDLQLEITDSAWPEAIQLQGRADAVLTRRNGSQRCIVELKLGRTAPQADLLQGCLYHLIMTKSDPAHRDAALAVMSFEPERHEHLFAASQLHDAYRALKALLAELAGFAKSSGAVTALPTVAAAPTPGTAPAIGISPVAADVLHEMKRKLAAAFAEYGAPLVLADRVQSGPAFVRFFATPQRSVSVRRIAQLAQDVWMRMGTNKAPQVSSHAGRVTIDVERTDRHTVDFCDWQVKFPARTAGGSARFVVGVGVDGRLHSADLSESQSPHLLVAGATGSGKSEWLRAFLGSMMAVNTPATLRFALIDPKRLAFSSLEMSPFLSHPIVYDEGALELLDRLIEEMEDRYQLLRAAEVDDLTEYNAIHRRPDGRPRVVRPLFMRPRIVCVCDEFADLLLRDKATRNKIEARVARLGVKGRAAGVHLVFATQRAGREVLKGAIDSNLPGRVALSVASAIDSRLILGEAGAETLLGKGDLLYKDIGEPVRLQGLWISREELEKLARG